jgi:hypothetical protein
VTLAARYGQRKLIQQSLGTSDPKVATLEVSRIVLRLADEAKAAEAEKAHEATIARLSPDQRGLVKRAGGVEGLVAAYERAIHALKCMEAGDPSRAMPTDEASDPLLQQLEVAEHRAAERVVTDHARETGKVLEAFGIQGRDVPGLNVETFSELVEAYIEAKGTASKTADAIRYTARRFKELHGDRPLAELSIVQLRTYSSKVVGLPVSTAPKLRELTFEEAVAKAKGNGLSTLSPQTRKKHVSFLKALTAFGRDQGHLAIDPWVGFKIVERRQKFSATARKVRRPFSPDEIRKLLTAAEAEHVSTLDHWAPLLATYLGARREEIGQIRRCDVKEVDGIWCVALTDEGEGQKVKNAASLRKIPLHPAVVAAGFLRHVSAIEQPDAFIFREQERWSGALRKLVVDGEGRLTERYGKRFRRLKEKVLGVDPAAVFHSFRHSWEDAAEAAKIPQTHRRVLAGRSRVGDSQAAYGDGPSTQALAASLAEINPLRPVG